MTAPLFLADLDRPQIGQTVVVTGDEGRHAVVVRRIRTGETVLVSDGAGQAVRGEVTATDKLGLSVRVDEVLAEPAPSLSFVAVQALAKGDRSELAIEMLTEIGVDEVVPWAAERSIVKWAPERLERALAKWRATVREATKQSRRFRVPVVSLPVDDMHLTARIPTATLALVLHEDATTDIAEVDVPAAGEVLIVIGPEGGIAPAELEAFVDAGAKAVRIADAVLRTSTAGVVAVGQLRALAKAR